MALGGGLIALMLSSTSKAAEDKQAEKEDAAPGEPNLFELYDAILEDVTTYDIDEILAIAKQLEEAGYSNMAQDLYNIVALRQQEEPELPEEESGLPSYYDVRGDGTDLWPWDLAEMYTGDGSRWPEFCEANPDLEKHPEWGCIYPQSGRLNIPEHWL